MAGEISSPIAGTIALPSAAAHRAPGATSLLRRETAGRLSDSFLESTVKLIDGRSGNNLERDERLEPILVLLRAAFSRPARLSAESTSARPRSVPARAGASRSFRDEMRGDHQFKLGWDWTRAGLTGFDEVTNDVEYSAAFLAPNAAGRQRRALRAPGLRAVGGAVLHLVRESGREPRPRHDDNAVGLLRPGRTGGRGRDLTLNLGLRYDWSSLFGDDKNNLAPRLGFAWDLGAEPPDGPEGATSACSSTATCSAAAATVPEKGGIFTRSAFDVALPRLGVDYTDSLIDLVITSGFPTGPRHARARPRTRPTGSSPSDLRADPLALYELLGIPVSNPAVPPVVNAGNVAGVERTAAAAGAVASRDDLPWHRLGVLRRPRRLDRRRRRSLVLSPRSARPQPRRVASTPRTKTPWTRAFTIGIDRQLTGDMSLSVSYVHRRSRDLLTRRITNLFDVAPGDPNFGQTTDGGPRISQVTYDGRIDYDGVVVALRKRFSRALHARRSRTPGRERTTTSSPAPPDPASATTTTPRADWGPSNLSAPNIFVANGAVTVPFDIQRQRHRRAGRAAPRSIRAASRTRTATASSTSET